MIIDKEGLYKRIGDHKFFNLTSGSLERKINDLYCAIDASIFRVGNSILREQEKVHLAYSGGIDSTIILTALLNYNFPVTIHTIASEETHPDMVNAKEFASELIKRGRYLSHKTHLIKESPERTEKANQILEEKFGVKGNKPENYYELLNAIKPATPNLVCGDCIDELLGGYYPHRDPINLPVYNKTKSLDKNRETALKYFMNKLIPDHLRALDVFSEHFGINVWLPYGNEKVMKAAEKFSVNELIDDENRKKPLSTVARMKNVPESIINKRKYGLVSALDKK